MQSSTPSGGAGAWRLVIFDCDGVLVDSEILSCGVHARALTAYGVPTTAADVARRFLGMAARDMRAVLEAELGERFPADHEARCSAELFDLFRAELRPVSGIGAVIDAVRSAGHAVCVASSSTPDRIALALDLTGLGDAFGPAVFSATQVGRGKPAPDLFLHSARAMGCPPERCVVVEDSVSGVTAARAAGMRAIGFVGGSHCPPGHGSRLSEAGADRISQDAGVLRLALDEELSGSV